MDILLKGAREGGRGIYVCMIHQISRIFACSPSRSNRNILIIFTTISVIVFRSNDNEEEEGSPPEERGGG